MIEQFSGYAEYTYLGDRIVLGIPRAARATVHGEAPAVRAAATAVTGQAGGPSLVPVVRGTPTRNGLCRPFTASYAPRPEAAGHRARNADRHGLSKADSGRSCIRCPSRSGRSSPRSALRLVAISRSTRNWPFRRFPTKAEIRRLVRVGLLINRHGTPGVMD